MIARAIDQTNDQTPLPTDSFAATAPHCCPHPSFLLPTKPPMPSTRTSAHTPNGTNSCLHSIRAPHTQKTLAQRNQQPQAPTQPKQNRHEKANADVFVPRCRSWMDRTPKIRPKPSPRKRARARTIERRTLNDRFFCDGDRNKCGGRYGLSTRAE